MTTSYPCPACGASADLASGCAGCGRAPDPDAAEVIRLNAEIGLLTLRLVEAREQVTGAEQALREAQHRREAAAARVRARLTASTPAVSTSPAAAAAASASSLSAPATPSVSIPAASVPAAVAPAASPVAETSTKVVQNVLFLLGGLLLGIAAIVFTAVAWATFGIGGRAVVLASLTAIALALPLLALRRRLTATAETIAAVALLLVALDGYAAWSVDLFGVSATSPARYAAAVFLGTAAVAAGYARVTGLAAPRYAALAAAQPVAVLAAVPAEPGATGWAVVLAATGALHLIVLHLITRRPRVGGALRVLLRAAVAGWLAAAVVAALIAEIVADTPAQVAAAGAALLLAAALVLAGVLRARSAVATAAGAGLVVATGTAFGRGALLLDGPAVPVTVAAVAAALAVLARYAGVRLPSPLRQGARIGAFVVLAVPALVGVLGAVIGAVTVFLAARPTYGAPWDARTGTTGSWWLPITLALVTAGVLLLLPAGRAQLVAVAAALTAVSLPAALHLPWWTAPALDTVAAAALLLAAVRTSRPAGVTTGAVCAAVLAGHALAVSPGRPAVHAATVAVLLGTGLLAAALALPGRARYAGGLAAACAVPLVPLLGSALAAAGGAGPVWTGRSAIVGLLLLVAAPWATAAEHRRLTYPAVLLTAATAPVWAAATGDSTAGYAAVALLVIAAGLDLHLRSARHTGGALTWPVAAAVLPGLWLFGAALPALAAVLLAPYAHLERIWSGSSGAAALPAGSPEIAVALAVAALAAVVLLRRSGRGPLLSVTGPLAALALLVGLGAAGVRWPLLPAVTLLTGLTGVLAAALRRRTGPDAVAAATVALLLTGAGVAGALPARWSILTALSLCLVTAVACGAAGRGVPARVGGPLGAVGAAILLAVAATAAAGLPRSVTAYAVLAVAALVLFTGTLLTGRTDASPTATGAAAVQGAGHATALVALLIDLPTARTAAVVLALWGVVLTLRALWPGERPAVRRTLTVAAATAELAGLWVVLASAGVAVTEAYTVPAAAVGLLAGWLALRSRPGLSSWQAYGPALAAGLLPSLGLVFTGGAHPVRRLALGAAALVIVVLGARMRRQAPVVVGGGVLVLVALVELARLWDLLPRWIPLAAGGLLLVGLAMTVERRRRDLHRVRGAVARMT